MQMHVVIISPATAKANNGNWQTASRWARFLGERYRVTVLDAWDGIACDALIALHARRSSSSIAAFHSAFPARPAILVLTGTDLYRDIKTNADAQRTLQLASRLVVLQEAGLSELDAHLRGKACVIYQSAPQLDPFMHKDGGDAEITMIGHLREEKDPLTFMRAAALVKSPAVRLTHIGGALDPALGDQALATQQSVRRYRWLGDQPHAAATEILRQSHLMVLTSKMEGGANVIVEALTGGVPVLASDISGNRGMLGTDYAGYFPQGDSETLARMIDRSLTDPAFYSRLKAQCDARAYLFSPQREQAAVLQLVDNLVPH
jgi:putative glycosyltransferase (TIGR04348 family)